MIVMRLKGRKNMGKEKNKLKVQKSGPRDNGKLFFDVYRFTWHPLNVSRSLHAAVNRKMMNESLKRLNLFMYSVI